MSTIGYEQIKQMLLNAAEAIRANHEQLSRLDSFGGDGDHGTTMVRAMGCLEQGMAKAPEGKIGEMLTQVGWAVMGVDGGATGPLFGSLFLGMGQAAGECEAVDAAGLAAMLEAGLTNLHGVTEAQPGDKTLVDALIPAVEAFKAAVDQGAAIGAAMRAAAEAARQGAEATSDMAARFGRARTLGEASKGHPDPGATSMALVFEGFAKGVQADGGS